MKWWRSRHQAFTGGQPLALVCGHSQCTTEASHWAWGPTHSYASCDAHFDWLDQCVELATQREVLDVLYPLYVLWQFIVMGWNIWKHLRELGA